jgi:hypothetical protein
MATEQIYNLCKDIQPFIAFDVKISPTQVMPCVGHEMICSNQECDCQLTHIAVCQKDSREILTCIIYGWRDYSYYIVDYSISEAKDLVRGVLNDSRQGTEKSKAILEAFRGWLSKDKAGKDKIFAARYKQFKLAGRNKRTSKERNAKLKKMFNLMYELFGEEIVEEFISGYEQSWKVKRNSGDQVANVSKIEDFKFKSKGQS